MTDAEQFEVAVVDAFTDEPLAGNAAGVVPDAEGLDAGQMQAVARELAVSETAFVTASDDADRAVRYFTPETEVDLCGHATVASHAYLRETGALDPGEHTLATRAGTVDVRVASDGAVWMGLPAPSVRRSGLGVDRERVAEVLGVRAGAVIEELPLAVADAGVPFLVVPLDYLSTLRSADPEDAAVRDVCAAVDAEGVYAFTFDTLGAAATLHGRAFAAPLGVSEDPVTGTASGAVGAYLREAGAFEEWPEELRFEQGHAVDRPGEVRVRVDGADVSVGGRAATALSGTVAVPDSGDDDIVEA